MSKIWTIVLSAGHGGSDSGASANGVKEKDANLAIVLACRDHLNQYYEGHNLILPRTTDVYVSLNARRDLTARVNADRYVSIHCDYYHDSTANGFSTHLSTGPLYAVTRGFRTDMHNTIYEYVKTLGVRDRGEKWTDHDVTRMMQCPTVVVEYMFVSNPREAQLLMDTQVLKNLGIHTALGLVKHLNLPRKQLQPEPVQPWPTMPTPKILRTVGVEVDGKRTDIVGFLADVNGRYITYLPMLDVAIYADVEVTGHGDHIKIDTLKLVK